MESDEGVDHGRHGNEGEQPRRNAARAIMPEVEQAHREPAEDDGEVQVREEGALVGEEYFRLHPRRERDAFSWKGYLGRGAKGGGGGGTGGGLEEGLRGHISFLIGRPGGRGGGYIVWM